MEGRDATKMCRCALAFLKKCARGEVPRVFCSSSVLLRVSYLVFASALAAAS